MKNTNKYFSIALLISLLISLLMHAPGYFDQFSFEGIGHREPNESLAEFLFELFLTLFISMVLFSLNYLILHFFQKTKKTSVWELSLSIVGTFIAMPVLNDFLFAFKHQLFDAEPYTRHGSHLFKNFLVATVVVVCTYILRLIFQKQSIELENEQLKRESLESQYQTLKNQVSPHFLFNSLNALQTLIREDADVAQKYVNHLSLVLRYTLQSNEKQSVYLSEELKYVESYLFLVQLRYEANLKVDITVPDKMGNLRLPPLSLQTLLENAIKHNEISKRKPLLVTISEKDDKTLVVSNPIQPKLRKTEGTGIGLYNLSKQYELISGQGIAISNENACFRVEIPLLNFNIL